MYVVLGDGEAELKVMVIIFFDEDGFLYQHPVCQSHTVAAVYYHEVFKKKLSIF